MEEQSRSCFGCRLANSLEEIQLVYEDEVVTCFLDISPLNEGHVLILPKAHYHDLDELDELTANAIMHASKRIAKALKTLFEPDGITIIQNNGAFNDLNHYHMHVFPRYKSDGLGWIEPLDLTLAKDRLPDTREKLIRELTR